MATNYKKLIIISNKISTNLLVMVEQSFAMWGCILEITRDCIDMTNAASTYLGIIGGAIIEVINKSDSIRMSHLAKELGMDRTTLTRNLSVLERQDLIKISSGKDNRTRIVVITQKGRTALAKAIPLWNEVQSKLKQQMGDTLWNELMNNLSQFVKVANQLNESE